MGMHSFLPQCLNLNRIKGAVGWSAVCDCSILVPDHTHFLGKRLPGYATNQISRLYAIRF